MGSLDEAMLTGFICRLCSKSKNHVVHIFGLEHLPLVKKIYVTVEVKIMPNDSLPKTVCLNCIDAIEKNYNFVRMVRKNLKLSKKQMESRLGSKPKVP